MKHKVTMLEMTCGACPSQWEGKTSDGAHVYIRYRYGYLYASVDGIEIVGMEIGDPLDGVMNTAVMTRLLSDVMEWNL